VADCNRLLRPGLQDARSHSAESQVLLVSGINEGVEDGILEDVPPVAVAQVTALDPGILSLDPFGGHGCRRALIVGPDLEAMFNPGTGARGNAADRQQTREHTAGHRERSQQPASTTGVGIVSPAGSLSHGSFLPCSLVHPARHAEGAVGKSGTIL